MTKLQETDSTLLPLEELFQKLFKDLPIGAFVVQGKMFRLFNSQFQSIIGYGSEEILAMDSMARVHPEDRDLVSKYSKQFIKGERFTPYEYRFTDKDGMVRWAMETVIPGQFQGKPAALGYSVEITERKQMEEMLRESERKYRELADSLPEIVFEIDMNGTVTWANRNGIILHGYSQEDFDRGINLFDLLVPSEREIARERFKRFLNGEKLPAREYNSMRKDGTIFPTLGQSSMIIREKSSVGLISIAIDITDLKNTRQMMQHYINGIIRVQEEERRRIARELHDETIQSLISLSLDIEAIARSSVTLPDIAIQQIQQLRGKLLNVTDDLRHICYKLRPEVLDQVGLLAALRLLTDELWLKGVATFIEIDGTEQRLPKEAEVVLFRIAQEALHNVARHSQATEAIVRLQFDDNQVRLRIVDNGCGFDTSNISDEYVKNSRLGLVGMQERARLLGAHLAVKSQPGEGTTITVEVGV